MKKTKILSVALAVILVFSIMSVCVSASDVSYSETYNYFVDGKNILNPEDFNVTINIDKSKILALDNESPEFTVVIDSITTSDNINYYDDEQAFFDVFTSETYEGAPVNVSFTVTFGSDKCFGDLNYTIDIEGFSAPPAISIPGLSDLGVFTPVTLSAKGNIPQFPSVDASTIKVINKPVKNLYNDTEKFDATGLEITCALTNGQTGAVTYSEETAYVFDFNPTSSEKLSVHDQEVAILLDGIPFLYVPIQVTHKYSDGFVSITNDYYTATKPGYHAIVCEGCGEAYNPQPHIPTDWVYNNDQTFLQNGTISSTCSDCGVVLTARAQGSADYNTQLGEYHFIRVILDYINMLLSIINGAL